MGQCLSSSRSKSIDKKLVKSTENGRISMEKSSGNGKKTRSKTRQNESRRKIEERTSCLTFSKNWALWQSSEASNRAERNVGKMRFLISYQVTFFLIQLAF